MTELKHLQQVILSIMKDIDELCTKNDIEYYLLGGSAIGAIRHKGFIPWDDDLDIVMTNANYQKFVLVCREQLDVNKYYLQVGLEDWPLNFSKIRLKGTILNEIDGYSPTREMQGIYVDIFKLDNVSSNFMMTIWQYGWAKYLLCYQLSQRTYRTAGLKKRLLMLLAKPLGIRSLRQFAIQQVERYNNQTTDYLGFFFGRTKFKTAITKRIIYGNPIRVPFEDTLLPVSEHYHEYLSQMFGNYMQLPPVAQRTGLHLISVDFGKY
ncbi:MAG: LicD family protein [Alistipes sp.]